MKKKSLIGWVRKDNLENFGKFIWLGKIHSFSELILRPKEFIDSIEEMAKKYKKVRITIEELPQKES